MRSETGGPSIARQIIPGDIEVFHEGMCLNVHYDVLVDVLDASLEVVASRNDHKILQIAFKGAEDLEDVGRVADMLISQYEMLPDSKRGALKQAIRELTGKATISSSGSQNLRRSMQMGEDGHGIGGFSLPQKAVDMTKEQVDDILRDALQKIHWGKENECLGTLRTLAEIGQVDRHLSRIIQHDPLMNTLINGLKKFASTSLPSCIKIMTIFDRMSFFPMYVEMLSRFKIGAMSLSLLHAQIALANVAGHNLEKDKLTAYLKSQNQLMKLTVSLLFNLSENSSTLRKMVNKDIVTGLVALLERNNAGLVVLCLKFLRKISMVSVIWSDIPYDVICEAVVESVFRWNQGNHVDVLAEGIELLYTFSFHRETFEEFRNSNVFEGIAKFVTIPELSSQLIRMFYQCSVVEGSDEAFRNETLLNMLIEATVREGDDRMVALVVLTKLSLDRECSKTIAKSPVFTSENLRKMFVDATSMSRPEDQVLMTMIRNVADSQPSLVKGFDEDIVKACDQNQDKPDVLCNIFAICNRAKMNSDRAKYFAGRNRFVKLIARVLKMTDAPPQLYLECVMLVSSIVLYSTPAQVLAKQDVVTYVIDIFVRHKDEMDIQTQCLFAFYRFICHSNTRSVLIKRPEIVDAVIQHSASKNAVVNQIGNSVLDALVTFDRTYAERIKVPRFDAFNQEWLQALEANKEVSVKP